MFSFEKHQVVDAADEEANDEENDDDQLKVSINFASTFYWLL